MNRVSKDDWKAQKDSEKAELESRLGRFLKSAIETKTGMDKLTAHYRISGLYTYSFHNCMLIMLQGGTIAQSYNKWKALDRCVNKGQKSHIQVYAPMFKKETDLSTGAVEQKLIGFRLVPVFDIEQTSGAELKYDHNSTDEMSVEYGKLAKIMTDLTGANIVEKITGSARGMSDGKTLTVSSMSNDSDKAKTLLHEVAHHLVHTGKDKEQVNVSEAASEVEAESVGYLVMSYLGMNYELSEAYVNSWKSGIADARHSIIIKTADKMIKAIRKGFTDEELFIAKI